MNPEDLTDEELLEEVWRRFGDSWCAFSSGVRPRDVCPVCGAHEPLTRHHLVPVARGGGKDRGIKQRYVHLCTTCHRLAHDVWGRGDRFRGPTERETLIRDLLRIRRERAEDG